MLTTGLGFTFTVWLAVALHPVELFVTVTVNVVVFVGLTFSGLLVEPVFHRYVSPPEADRVIFVPAQIVVGPLIEAFGKGLTLTTTLAVLEQL
jgi:hypothetical protein